MRMHSESSNFPCEETAIFRLADDLARQGWAVIDDFLPPPLWRALARETRARFAAGDFRPAGIGRRAQVDRAVRGDAILWLDPQHPAEAVFLQQVEQLRLALNRTLYLGLLDYEGHYAHYPAGAFYRRHLDQPRGRSERTVTLICYLNADWRIEDGSALRLYLGDGGHLDILPLGGRAVIFLSARFEHEVLPARRPRLALTGWLRRRIYGGRFV